MHVAICHIESKTSCFHHAGDVMAELDVFTDGLWHSVNVDIESGGDNRIGKVNITVDGKPDAANRQLTFTTTVDYFIGGELVVVISV